MKKRTPNAPSYRECQFIQSFSANNIEFHRVLNCPNKYYGWPLPSLRTLFAFASCTGETHSHINTLTHSHTQTHTHARLIIRSQQTIVHIAQHFISPNFMCTNRYIKSLFPLWMFVCLFVWWDDFLLSVAAAAAAAAGFFAFV